jgi:APA family basic amino acid/polyamine antiporter
LQTKKIGLTAAICLVVANMIGTGIFTSLGFQVGALPSVSVLMLLWLAGGLIALCGGLSYITLAKELPGSGGEYHYITQHYPRVVAWFAALVSILGGFAAPIALACMAFAAYFKAAINLPVVPVAIGLLSMVFVFHFISIRVGSNFQIVITLFKLFILLFIIYFGLRSPIQANPISFSNIDLSLLTSAPFATSLVYFSFAYSGWNACVYIFTEIKQAQMTIKRAVIIGILIVMLLYLSVTWIFLKVVPMQQLKGVVEVGALVSKYLFGVQIGKWVSMTMALLLISTISSMVWISPRVLAKVAKDHRINYFARFSDGIPINAMALNYLIIVLLIITGTFQQILASSAILMNTCGVLCVAILFKRKRKIDQLIAPLIFVTATLCSTLYLIFEVMEMW